MRRNCVVFVLWDAQMQKQLPRIKNTASREKQVVLDFWQKMMNNGYRHFYLYVNSRIEYWVVEMLYFMRNTLQHRASYTLILNSNDSADVDFEHYWTEIVSNARDVLYWQDWWRPLNYATEVLDLYK